MRHASGQPAQGLHFLRLEKLCFQLALFCLVKLHAKDAFLVANAHQGSEVQADMLGAGCILESDFQVLYRPVRPEFLVELVAQLLRFPEAQFNRALADHLFRRQGQHAQQMIIHVQEDAIHRQDAAPNRTLAKNRGKPLFRLFERNLTLLSFGNIDRRALNETLAIRACDDGGALQDPEYRAVLAPLRALVVQHLAFPAQVNQKLLPLLRMGIKKDGGMVKRLFFGVKSVHPEKSAVAIQELAFRSWKRRPRQGCFQKAPDTGAPRWKPHPPGSQTVSGSFQRPRKTLAGPKRHFLGQARNHARPGWPTEGKRSPTP